jgi:hypothetical protein
VGAGQAIKAEEAGAVAMPEAGGGRMVAQNQTVADYDAAMPPLSSLILNGVDYTQARSMKVAMRNHNFFCVCTAPALLFLLPWKGTCVMCRAFRVCDSIPSKQLNVHGRLLRHLKVSSGCWRGSCALIEFGLMVRLDVITEFLLATLSNDPVQLCQPCSESRLGAMLGSQGGFCVRTQTIGEEWQVLDGKKRKSKQRLMRVDGYNVLKENAYTIEEVS